MNHPRLSSFRSGPAIASAITIIAAAVSVLALQTGCGTSSETGAPSAKSTAETSGSSKGQKVAPASATNGAKAYAYLAGGCFWGVEHYLERLPGVSDVVSGYMGGHLDNPTYRDVIGKKTGHLETVKVTYDPSRVTYGAIAKLFFEIHDPTQANGQGPDLGPQYLSAVFTNTDEERATVEGLIGQLTAKGLKVATSIIPVKGRFWPAEKYHQDYYARTGKQPYCHVRKKRFD